jgi:hypothetical protein
MNIIKALEARDALCAAYADAWSTAETFGTTASDLIARMKRAEERHTKAPRWVHQYAKGYAQALSDRAYAKALVYGGFIDGVFYSTHRARPDYYQTQGIEPKAFAELSEGGRVIGRGHYWDTAQGMRPYFIA